MSATISGCVASEQVNIAVFATTTSPLCPDVVDDLLDIDVVGDVAAAVADIDADAPSAGLALGGGHDGSGVDRDLLLAHAGTSSICGRGFVRSRCAATWATAAPAWRMESAMSLAPDAAPAT